MSKPVVIDIDEMHRLVSVAFCAGVALSDGMHLATGLPAGVLRAAAADVLRRLHDELPDEQPVAAPFAHLGTEAMPSALEEWLRDDDAQKLAWHIRQRLMREALQW
jgi:hypothetical protein